MPIRCTAPCKISAFVSSYVRIWIKDLTPNVGLFWYFFIEMFRQFRTYFLLAFLFIHAFIGLPLCYRFRYALLLRGAHL